MSVLQIMTPEGADSPVVRSKAQSDPTKPKGYIRVTQSSMVIDPTTTWVREMVKSALIKGELTMLNKIVKSAGTKMTIPGNLQVREILESELFNEENADLRASLPTAIKHKSFDEYTSEDKDLLEQSLETLGLVKRAGTDGIELTYNGERILRFVLFDATGEKKDVLIKHTNSTEVMQDVAERRERAKVTEANFQGAEEDTEEEETEEEPTGKPNKK